MTGEQIQQLKKRKRKSKKAQQGTEAPEAPPAQEAVELRPEQPRKKLKGQLNGSASQQVSWWELEAPHAPSRDSQPGLEKGAALYLSPDWT